MKARATWAVPAAIVALAAAAPARADEGARLGEGPRVFSIQPRPYHLGHEFQLGAGVLPLDAFYIGVVPAASYTYHFTDFWAWEIASIGYSLNFDTSLRGELNRDYGVEPVAGGGDRIHLFGTTSLVVKPLFGKLAVFNSSIVHSETFFAVGLGGLLLGKYPRPVVNLGFGLRFWSTETLSVRFDLRDYLVFRTWLPEHALFGMLSVSFNFVSSPLARPREGAR